MKIKTSAAIGVLSPRDVDAEKADSGLLNSPEILKKVDSFDRVRIARRSVAERTRALGSSDGAQNFL